MSTRDQGKEKSLRQSEDMFRLLFESVADALFLHDLEGRFLEVNQAACDSLGYTREELLQLPFLSIVKDQDPEALGNLWARVLQGEKLTAQGFHQRRDGATFPIEVHLSPFEYEGRPHILASARDITERREAEKVIQASVEKYRRLQANIPGMVYVYALHPDGSYSFPYANAASRELFDVAPADLMRDGALLAGLIHPDDRERRDQAIRHSAVTLQPFREELRHIVQGEVRWYDCMSRPEPQPNGDILWDGIMLEITDRKRAEAALAESEQRFSTFMDHLPAAVFIKDQEGRLLFANRYLQETFGWEDCLGKTTEELLPREMAARMIEDDQRVLAAGPVVIQERITDVQGVEHFFDTYKFPIIAEGSPSLLGGIAVDVTADKRALAALELSEQKYHSFYESILDGFASVDLDGNIVETNQAYLEMIGYTAAEVQGLRYQDLTPAKWHKFEADLIEQQVLTRGYSDTYEKEYIRKDGTVFPVELRAYLLKDKAGAAADMWAFVRDITALKQGEAALRESEDRYRSLFQNNHAVMLLVDPENGSIMDANPAACTYYGFSKEKLLAMKITDLNTLPQEQIFQAMHSAMAEGRKRFEFPHRLATGAIRDVEIYTGPIRIKGQELLYSIVHDVTARKEAEKALQESEARFRQVVESSPLPIGLANADGTIAYVNPKFVETFKYTQEDVPRIADWYRRAYPDPAYRQRVVSRWQEGLEKTTLGSSTTEAIEVEIICKDGSKRIMEIFGAQMGNQTLAVFNDLTERKRMEEAMEKRLVTLSRPLDDAADINFHDLFNLEDIQKIQDLFAKSTGVSSLITTPDGAPITRPSNFCRLCGSLIRQTELGRQKCAASDAALGRYSPEGPTIHHCLSAGLCGAGASITVGGKHIANWIIGQVRDETVNEESIRDYARALGVDEEEFIAAFLEVPTMSSEQFQQVAQALFVFANQLSAMAYQNVQQARFITERKQAEERLLVTQERLELALQGADLGTWDWNVKTGALMFNKRYAEMLGYTLAEVKPHLHFWEKLVHPDDLPAVMELLNAHLEGQTPFYETEHRLRHKLGEWVWVLDKGKVIEREPQGKAVRACGTHLDITERKKAEVALRDSEERLRLALQAANQGLYDLNIQTGEAKVSPEYATMLGYDPGVFQETNTRWIERLHADDREQVAATFQAYVRGDIPDYAVEYRQRTQAGDWKWILSLGKVVAWDEVGKPLRMLGTHTDITERKQAEEALRESEKRLREAQEMAHLGFWYWNVKTGDVTWSEEVYNIFQLDPKEFTPRIDSILELSPWPEDHERDQELIRKAMESHEKGAFEQRFLLPDKSIGYYYSTFQGKYDDGGNLIFIVGTVLDITARKRAEEERARLEDQMREVQKLESLGVLAGGIAHDFNNLLMAILGNADLALLSLSPASPAHPKLEQIVRASQRAADLCGQMLAYSGKGRFVVGRYDLSEIVQEMAQMLKVSVSKKVALRYFFAADLPAVEVDATQMRQVIMNLITNASEALGDQSGFISVSTGVMDCDRAYLAESYLDDKLPEGEYVYLEVADTGSGIDEETRRRIFDPFFTTKFTGRGLGLAAVLGIVRGHQGAIKVYSEVGQGATFKVLLPAREWAPGDRGPSAAQSIPPLSRGGTILLVDDDPEVRDVGSQMLERLGFKVLTAAHGREGLKVFQEYGGEIDCVILDLTMPEMGGEEVFRELHRLRSNVRVILSSGYNEQEVTQRFAGKGLAGFIQKPYRVVNIQEVLNRVFG